MRVPEMKSKSSCLRKTETGVNQHNRPEPSPAQLLCRPKRVVGNLPAPAARTSGTRLRLHAWVYSQ